MGRIARALATGYGYANPFNGHTGPTAWEPPLYPLLLAGVFKLCGVYSALSGWVILSLNSVFSAATAVFLYFIADRCYNRRIALWSAWIWALYPAAMQFAVRWVWETSLTCMLFTAVLALTVKMRGISPREPISDAYIKQCHSERSLARDFAPDGVEEPADHDVRAVSENFADKLSGSAPGTPSNQTTRNWLLFGLLWGLIGLCDSTLLLFLPVCGLWILLGSPVRAVFLRAVASALVFIAVVSPWMVRNYLVFHTFIPFRTNFGAELYAGNNPEALGFPWGKTVNGEAEVRAYTQLGEPCYSRQQGALAKAWIAAHPARFLEISLKRFYFFWSAVPHPATRRDRAYLVLIRNINYCVPNILTILGLILALRRRKPAAVLFLWAFILVPFTYYFVTSEARFRHPLEPLIVILSVYLFQSAEPRRTSAQ